MKNFKIVLGLLSLGLILNCGGGSSGSNNNTNASESGTTGTVAQTTGSVTAADGSPIAGATVVLSQNSGAGSSLVKIANRDSFGRLIRVGELVDDESETCDDITVSGTVIAEDCTDAEGLYSLIGDIPCGTPLTINIVRGSFSLSATITIACSDSDGDGDFADEITSIEPIALSDDCGDGADCDFDIANMAVVTGDYDEIENVLAKLGYGSVDAYGSFDPDQPFSFTLIDGNGSLDDAAYENFDDLLNDLDRMNEFDIIFINCGNDFESLSTDPTVLANLQSYVENGGKLYVTDWSYMFLEQPFPSFMDFLGGGSDASVAETPIYEAKDGVGGIETNATVNDTTMATWLDGVRVNTGDIETDCYLLEESDVNGTLGARNADGTVTIGDFLSAWVVMEGTHSGVTPAPTVWIEGIISHYGASDVNAPLTVSQDRGLGRVLYSSYHTAHSCPTQGFWPQERILQFLVFGI